MKEGQTWEHINMVPDGSEAISETLQAIIAVCELTTFYDDDKRRLIGALSRLLERQVSPPQFIISGGGTGGVSPSSGGTGETAVLDHDKGWKP